MTEPTENTQEPQNNDGSGGDFMALDADGNQHLESAASLSGGDAG
jgi:hypothetical protein